MHMAILSARYIVDGQFIQEFKRDEIDSQIYHKKLKGFLYCPTPNCHARVIHYSGKRVFLKTWNNDDHAENCLHGFERVRGKVGVDTTRFINVELTPERKKRALKEALAQYNMTEEEREQKKQKQATRKKNPTTIEKRSQPSANLVLVNDDSTEEGDNIGVRGPNLSKRTPDMLRELDAGKPRLVMGIITEVNLNGSTAEIIVVEKSIRIHVKFEEVFNVNSPTYLPLFHHIQRYITETSRVVFTGIGEVRASRSGDYYELSVFYGQDFEVDGMTLPVLAAHYARGA